MADALERLAAEKSGLDFGTVTAIFRKRKWLMVIVTLAVPALVAVIVSKQPKLFRATASLVIDVSVPQYLGAGFRDVVEMEPSWWSSREALETEFRVLRSDSLAVAVMKDLCRRQLPGESQPALRHLIANVNCNNPAEYENNLKPFRDALTIDPVKESRVVNLTVVSRSPEFAALLANTTSTIYLERNLDRRLSQSQYAATWLEGEYGDLAGQLRSAEQALVEFKKRNNIVVVSLEDDQNELSAKRKRIATELSNVEVKLINIRAQREMLASIHSTDPLTDFNPELGEKEAAVKLKELYMEQYGKLLELRSKYLEKHPAVIAMEARVNAIKADLTPSWNSHGRTSSSSTRHSSSSPPTSKPPSMAPPHRPSRSRRERRNTTTSSVISIGW